MKGPISSKFSLASGFTLLEVMVAVSLMAVVLVAVMNLYMQTVSLTNTAKFYSIAPQLSQKALTNAEMTLIDNRREDFSGDFGDSFPGYRWTVSVVSPAAESFGTAIENLKKIDVTVTFNENEFIYKLRTYRLFQQ
jgi:general secretion pathway protein I